MTLLRSSLAFIVSRQSLNILKEYELKLSGIKKNIENKIYLKENLLKLSKMQ